MANRASHSLRARVHKRLGVFPAFGALSADGDVDCIRRDIVFSSLRLFRFLDGQYERLAVIARRRRRISRWTSPIRRECWIEGFRPQSILQVAVPNPTETSAFFMKGCEPTLSTFRIARFPQSLSVGAEGLQQGFLAVEAQNPLRAVQVFRGYDGDNVAVGEATKRPIGHKPERDSTT